MNISKPAPPKKKINKKEQIRRLQYECDMLADIIRTVREIHPPQYTHCCHEWDGLEICEYDPEFAACICFKDECPPIDKTAIGLYPKFNVSRTDGQSAPGKKHHKCKYFVLDLTHDKFAIPAIKAYEEACREEYTLLADDLKKWLRIKEHKGWESRADSHLTPIG